MDLIGAASDGQSGKKLILTMIIRVLVVADNQLLGKGAMSLLSDQPDIKASFIRGFDDESFRSAHAVAYRIVLVDARLNSDDSLRVVKRIRARFPAAEVIVMNLTLSRSQIIEFVKAGVSGFILEDAVFGDYLATIRSVAEGKIVLPPDLTGPLFSKIVRRTGRKPESRSLTKREQEVADLVAKGHSNKEIATTLCRSVHTIKSHVHNILGKLSLHTRLELARHIFISDRATASPTVISSGRRGINRRD